MPHRDVVEVVTLLGDTSVDHSLVARGARIGDLVVDETAAGFVLRGPDGERALARDASLRLPCGLGAIVVRVVARPPRMLPRAPADRRSLAFLASSLAVHFTVLAIAVWTPVPDRPPPHSRGAPRPRLVANHTTATRAMRAPVVVASTHEVDQPELEPLAEQGTPMPPAPEPDHAASQMTGAKPADAGATTPTPAMDATRQSGEEAARHFDPCTDGDCGLIATTRFATASTGAHAGDEFKLPARQPRGFSASVVECSVDGACNTVSGTDQNDIRAEIAHHIAEVDACFDRYADASAAVDARIEELGTVHVSAHDARAASSCIADVIAKLKFSAGERDVTLAFAAPAR